MCSGSSSPRLSYYKANFLFIHKKISSFWPTVKNKNKTAGEKQLFYQLIVYLLLCYFGIAWLAIKLLQLKLQNVLDSLLCWFWPQALGLTPVTDNITSLYFMISFGSKKKKPHPKQYDSFQPGLPLEFFHSGSSLRFTFPEWSNLMSANLWGSAPLAPPWWRTCFQLSWWVVVQNQCLTPWWPHPYFKLSLSTTYVQPINIIIKEIIH